MTQIVIDTNAYSFLCHGQEDIAKLLFAYDVVHVPSIVLGELEAGFRKGSRYRQNKAGLERFLAIERVHIADVDSEVAITYGIVHTRLKAQGTMIPLNDVWIASTAMALGAPLVTYDQHFAKVEGLDLILKEVRP